MCTIARLAQASVVPKPANLMWPYHPGCIAICIPEADLTAGHAVYMRAYLLGRALREEDVHERLVRVQGGRLCKCPRLLHSTLLQNTTLTCVYTLLTEPTS